MHNTVFPGSAKFQGRPASPQFANLSPPGDYPHAGAASAASPFNAPHLSMSMRHPKGGLSSKSRAAATTSGHHLANSSTMGMMGPLGAAGSHHRGDLTFPDDMDSIEFCMPPPPAPSNGIGHGVNGEMLLFHGSNGLCQGEPFNERRRRGHSRRSNHKVDVEQQVKWSRKNIAATMERFEPATHSSSSQSSLEYGFAAGVVDPSPTPLFQPQMSPVQQPQPYASSSVPSNHVYSYAYYEPGAAKCHTNVPHRESPIPDVNPPPPVVAGPSKSPSRRSIHALLAKGFRSRSNNGQSTSSSPSTEDRHTYTTRYGTTENLYEEVNDQKIRKVLSDNRIAGSCALNAREEMRRVQHNHFRVLDQLNLSLEALIMPPTPPDSSPNHPSGDCEGPMGSAAAGVVDVAVASSSSMASTASSSQRPRRVGLLGGASSSSSASSQQRALSHGSLENLSATLHSMELKELAHNSCINPEFDEGDLDSGFSGSGSSSGASYNESLRYYKTGTHTSMQTTTLPPNGRSCRSSTASANSASKISMNSSEDQGIGMMSNLCVGPAVGYTRGVHGNGEVSLGVGACGSMVNNGVLGSPCSHMRRCSETQRASSRSTSTGAKPKKSFWSLKP